MPLTSIIGYESVTVSSTAIGISATGLKPNAASVQVEGAAVRFRADGTDPTAAVGVTAEPGDSIVLTDRDQVLKFKAIRRDGVDATLRVHVAVEEPGSGSRVSPQMAEVVVAVAGFWNVTALKGVHQKLVLPHVLISYRLRDAPFLLV